MLCPGPWQCFDADHDGRRQHVVTLTPEGSRQKELARSISSEASRKEDRAYSVKAKGYIGQSKSVCRRLAHAKSGGRSSPRVETSASIRAGFAHEAGLRQEALQAIEQRPLARQDLVARL